MTLPRLAEKKRLGEPIVMVTAYDYPSAQVAQEAGVDIVLVGDSGAMTVLGYPSTVPVSTDEMLMLAAAVRRGLPDAVRSSATCRSGPTRRPTSRRSRPPSGSSRRPAATRSSSSAAAPACSAPGDRRRRHPGDGSRRADAADRDGARRLQGAGPHGRTTRSTVARDAIALEEAGCFAIVFEAIPASGHRGVDGAARDSGDRDRRRPGDRRPGARLPRPARDLRRPRRAVRQALRRDQGADGRRRRRVRGRGPRRHVPGARAHLLDRRGRARDRFRRTA